MKQLGYGMTDILSSMNFVILSFCASFAGLSRFPRQAKLLTIFFEKTAKVGKSFTVQGLVTKNDLKTIFDENLVIIKLKKVLFIFHAIFWSLFYYSLFKRALMSLDNYEDSMANQVVFILMFVLWIPFNFTIALPISVDYLENSIIASVSFVTKSFENWKNELDNLIFKADQRWATPLDQKEAENTNPQSKSNVNVQLSF